MELEAEFTSEPFQGEGTPPAHAVLAREAAEKAGLRADFGPLGTTVSGDGDAVLAAMPEIARAALDGGATRLTLQIRHAGDLSHRPGLELTSALERLIDDVERELGGRLGDLDRAGKQQAVRLFKERGAFTLRKSVETVAQALGVTRFTVYNYLNRDTG